MLKPVVVFLSMLTLLVAACAPSPAGAPIAPGQGSLAVQPTQSAVTVGEAPTPGPTATPIPAPELLDAIWSATVENYVYTAVQNVDWQARYDAIASQIGPETTSDELVAAVRAQFADLPPDVVSLQTRAELEADLISSLVGYEGIGAYIGFRGGADPKAVVLEVVLDSPAQSAGLAGHDAILAVDGVAVQAEEGMNVVNRIRGAAGSETLLTVQSPGQEPRDVPVTRGQMTFAPEKSTTVTSYDEGAIGYILFPAGIYPNLAADVAEKVGQFTQTGALQGLILDLRIANNSTNWPLMLLLPFFTTGDAGAVYTLTDEQPLQIGGQDIGGSQSLPLAILVGPDTLGTPEIFAAAMQATGRAAIVGLPTQGVVEGMDLYPMPDGSRVMVATSSYRTTDGREIGLEGVQPDILVEADWNQVTGDADPVIEAALESLRSQGQ